jgi:hypothetical protein
MKIFGVINHSPDEVISALSKVSDPHFYMVPYGNVYDGSASKRTKYILFINPQDFLRSVKNIGNKTAIVFAAPMFFHVYKNIVLLDATWNDTDLIAEELLNLQVISDTKESPLPERCQSYEDYLEEKAQKGSLLGDFMTFIYKLNVKTHQKPVKMLCANFIVSSTPVSTLPKLLDKLNKAVPLTPRIREAITVLLTSPQAAALQKAFESVTDYESIDDASEKHGVSAYEMRYMHKIISNIGKQSIDDHLTKQ